MISRRKLVLYYKNKEALDLLRGIKSTNVIYQSVKEGYAVIFTETKDYNNVCNKFKTSSLVKEILVDDTIYEI